MENWVRAGPVAVKGGSERSKHVPPCGDEWCINGPPGEDYTTYFLCEICAARAPDVASAELTPAKLKSLTLKQKRAYNATALASRICVGLV